MTNTVNNSKYALLLVCAFILTFVSVDFAQTQELPNPDVFFAEKREESLIKMAQNSPEFGLDGIDGESPFQMRISQPHIKTRMKKADAPVIDLLELKNVDIIDVLKLISQKSGLNVIAGNGIAGKISVFLRDIEVKEALRIIVESYGWAIVEEDNVIKVMTNDEFQTRFGKKFGENMETSVIQLNYAKAPDVLAVLNQMKSQRGAVVTDEKTGTVILTDNPAKLDEMFSVVKKMDVPMKTEIFKLSYGKAEEVYNKVSELVTPDVGQVRFDERSNQIVVSDTLTKIAQIEHIINAFDKQDTEVLIEAKILQITLSDQFKLGVDWTGVLDDHHPLELQSNFDILSSSDKGGKLSVGTIGTDKYAGLVEALDSVGVTEILSSPRVAVLNNKEAKILVGSSEPYVTTTTTTTASGPTTTAETVNFIEVGVKLYVTPTIHDDGYVSMQIKPEVSSVTSNLVTSNNNTIPIVETSEAETSIMVKDGVTIVIGGLIKEERLQTVNKVPFLGDIPYLGRAFRNDDDEMAKTEIAIFLTPQIIKGDGSDVMKTSFSSHGLRERNQYLMNE